MGNDPAGIVDKSDQEGFAPFAVRLFDGGRPIHRVSLPQLVGKLHGERQAQLVRRRVIQELIIPNHPVKGGGS